MPSANDPLNWPLNYVGRVSGVIVPFGFAAQQIEFRIRQEDIVVPFNCAIRRKAYAFIELGKSDVISPNLGACEGRK